MPLEMRAFTTEAAARLITVGLRTLFMNPAHAETDTRNTPSGRVLDNLGLVREGTLREDCIVNGEMSDSWVYGLLMRQWKPIRAAHAAAVDASHSPNGLTTPSRLSSHRQPR